MLASRVLRLIARFSFANLLTQGWDCRLFIACYYGMYLYSITSLLKVVAILSKVKNRYYSMDSWRDGLPIIAHAESPLTPLPLGSRDRSTLQICSAATNHMATLTACTVGVYCKSRQASLLLSATHNQTLISMTCFDACAACIMQAANLKMLADTWGCQFPQRQAARTVAAL